MSTLHLACGGSYEYLPHIAAMLDSVLERSGDQRVQIHYLHGPDVPDAEVARLEGMIAGAGGTIRPLLVDEACLAGLPRTDRIPQAMWYRTFLPEVLPDVDRVLYLDADTIVLDGLAELWHTDLRGNWLAAVTNVWEPWNEGYPVHGLGLAHRDAYFNSGVVLMDVARLRAESVTERVLAHARARESLPWGDQDSLNAVLAHRRLPLHPRWNCMNSVLLLPRAADVFGQEAVAEARARPAIRHFEGPSVNKPWHLLAPFDARAEYLRHRRRTPWPRVRREGITPRNLARYAGRRVRAALERR